jgi:hypothetical protein
MVGQKNNRQKNGEKTSLSGEFMETRRLKQRKKYFRRAVFSRRAR